MASIYRQFLNAPNSSLLAETATLHYVTTTTTFTGSTDIIKHLNTLQKQVKKKQQDIINVLEDRSSAVLEVDNVFEFVTSGGTYLPGLDDNFVADRTVYFPSIHIVNFDAEGKISQIRQSWDQGALLKQIEVIGKSGRNWPIRDSREQLTMIKAALKASGATAPSAPSVNETTARARGNSSNAMRDPHASLQLFGNREEIEAVQPSSVASPYAGNRPAQRGFTDILGDDPDGSHHQATMSPSKAGLTKPQRGFTDILGDERSDAHYSEASHQRSASPAKIGAGKHYQPMRLFEGQEHVEEEEEEETPKGKTAPPAPKQPVPENRQKAVKMMNSNWSSYDESPKSENQRINVAGDGMGSRKGADATAPRKGYNRDNLAENKIAIAGDGMGGKKGTDRSWLYGGDENEEPLPTSRKAPGMRGGNAQSSLWNM